MNFTDLPITIFLSFIFTYFTLKILLRSRLVEHFHSQKSHPANSGNIAPQFGGLAIIPTTVVVSLIIAYLYPQHPFGFTIFFSILVLTLCGLWAIDDLKGAIPIGIRMLLQLAIACAVLLLFLNSSEINISKSLISPIFFPIIYCFMLIFLIGAMNATNFMDGIDWAILSLVLPGYFLFCYLYTFDMDSPFSIILLSITSALLAFGVYNWPPAKAFLGDNGSLPLGFVSGSIGIVYFLENASLAGVIPFAYLYFDAFFTFIKRAVKSSPLFASHSDHAYQIASKTLGSQTVAIWMFGASIFNTCLAATCMFSNDSLQAQLTMIIISFLLNWRLFTFFVNSRNRTVSQQP